MKRILIIGLFTSLLICCNSNKKEKLKKEEKIEFVKEKDSGYTDYKTKNLIIGKAEKTYSTKNRKKTRFPIIRNSIIETTERNFVKISEKEILICDKNEKIVKSFKVLKKWIDKTGPSNVYDLKDKNGTEYYLDHYIDIDKKNYLAFRFKDSLTTYTDE